MSGRAKEGFSAEECSLSSVLNMRLAKNVLSGGQAQMIAYPINTEYGSISGQIEKIFLKQNSTQALKCYILLSTLYIYAPLT